jgi:epoxide hydrolase-like predicted phosphatase
MQIKAIIFDLGQVLDAPKDPAEAQARRQILADKLGLDPADLWTYLFEGEPSRRWMTGQITQDQFWREVVGEKGITEPQEIELFPRLAFADTGKMNGEMADLIRELKGHYLLAVLSNTSWSEDYLKQLLYGEMGLPPGTFDVLVTSKSVGATKPDPRIFQHALERLAVKPEEAVFTDDLANFTEAAAKLGINVHTFTIPASFRQYLIEIGVLPVKTDKPG